MTKTAHNAAPPKPVPGAPSPLDPAAAKAREFRNALGAYGTGVTIITAAMGDRIVGLTCNSFASVSLNPAMVLWSLGTNSPNLTLFQEASHFAVNVLGTHQADLAMTFARSGADKFAGVKVRTGRGGAPVIDGCIAEFECRNEQRHYGGDHVIFLGLVEHFSQGTGEPLLFSRGAFGSFKPSAG
jgi:flavin reductase (DIM6/NTAB) family NADH-FMN oxidoreductase RutF